MHPGAPGLRFELRAISGPRGLLTGLVKAKRELREGRVPKQELGNEGRLPVGSEEKMAGRGSAAILAFFGVDPKKVPLF